VLGATDLLMEVGAAVPPGSVLKVNWHKSIHREAADIILPEPTKTESAMQVCGALRLIARGDHQD
jgi:hypothetical protein